MRADICGEFDIYLDLKRRDILKKSMGRPSIKTCAQKKREEKFVDIVEEIFGPGSGVLEIQIMKRLYEKVGPFKHFPDRNLTFTEYVETACYL